MRLKSEKGNFRPLFVCFFSEENVPSEVKFFDLKLLFLLTALCPQIRKTLREEQDVNTHLIQIMERTLKEGVENGFVINVRKK